MVTTHKEHSKICDKPARELILRPLKFAVFFFPVKIKSARESYFWPFFGFFHGHFCVFTPTFLPIFQFFHAHFFFSRALFIFFFVFSRFFHGHKIHFHGHKTDFFHGQLFFFTGTKLIFFTGNFFFHGQNLHHGILAPPVSSVRAVR